MDGCFCVHTAHSFGCPCNMYAPLVTCGASAPLAPSLLCRDGYVTAVWHASSATLSLDMLAASNAAAGRMAQAAQVLCERLVAEWPGSRIEASSLARLPRKEL